MEDKATWQTTWTALDEKECTDLTVIMLGAGASLEADTEMPLDGNFFKKVTEKIQDGDTKYSELFKLLEYLEGTREPASMERFFTLVETFERWLNFAQETNPDITKVAAFFPPLPYMPLAPALNETLSPKRLQEILGRNPNHYFKYNVDKLVDHQRRLASHLFGRPECHPGDSFELIKEQVEQAKKQLQGLIFRLILESIQKTASPPGSFRLCEKHQSLFSRYVPTEADKQKGVVVISYNYDLYADTALAKALGSEWLAEPFYFQLFDPTPRVICRLDDKRGWRKNAFMLKMHGSVNWLTPVHGKKKFFCHGASAGQLTMPNLEYLSDHQLEPVIIPPVLDKFERLEDTLSGHHGRSWTVALDALLKAKRWVFFGYSLPSTDFHSEWLYKMALAYRKESDSLEVAIIDPGNFTHCDRTTSKEHLTGTCRERNEVDQTAITRLVKAVLSDNCRCYCSIDSFLEQAS